MKSSRILLACAIGFGSFAAASADVYKLVNYPALQNGLAVTGVLNAADLNSNALLEPSELASWSLTIDSTTKTSDLPGAGMLLSNVSISGGEIFLEDAAISGVGEQMILAIALDAFVNYSNEPFDGGYNAQVYNGRSGPTPSPSWSQQTLITGGPNLAMPIANGRMVIARLIPEPDSLIVCLTAALGAACASRCNKR
jgi:hypothetical protein